MALNLPANFKRDIQGDTALVPFVIIGNLVDNVWDRFYFISTNQMNLGAAGQDSDGEAMGDRISLPILLNIPSLKESIDIESRNYKISNITLDISNFPYNGERFSELVGSNSLINTECRIYWASPSTTSHSLSESLADADAMPIYNGKIRRYTHDDEKVKLVVEDRSQATLHKDLPLPENYLTGDEVPDKYKNIPMPLVYGLLDKSPCVIRKAPSYTEWGTDEGEIELLADNDSNVQINNLYIYGDAYIDIPQILDLHGQSDIFDYLDGMQQFTIENNTIKFASTGGWDSQNINPISDNKILGYHFINKKGMSFKPMITRSVYWSTDGWNPDGGGSRSWYGSYLGSSAVGSPYIYGSLLKEPDGDDETWDGDYYIDSPTFPEDQFYINIWGVSGGVDGKHEMKLVGATIQTNAATPSFIEQQSGFLNWEAFIYAAHASAL